MARRSPVFLALLLTSSAVLAKSPSPPRAEGSMDMPADLQLIGWSKDEKRFAVRVYALTDSEGDGLSEPPPYCAGYVDHRGKKFRGGLLIQLYEGTRPTMTWPIQDSERCTPPETARERLAQAKAALEQQGVDLLAIGTVLAPRKGAKRPASRGKGQTVVTTATTKLVLPSGPQARQTVDITCRVERRETGKGEDMFTSRATFMASLRSSRKPTPLGEFTLGPTEWSPMMAGQWAPTVDRLFLSPSGKSFVLLARLDEGNMRALSSSSVVLGLVELPAPPQASATTSAPAR